MIYFSVHGHFYQPPRDDPASGEIPREHGAEPYANFNEKINAECYAPNARERNYERISFDFGPTLLSWMKGFSPTLHRQLAAADRASRRRFGSGGAMAQSYHHTILPLANRAEKELEIAWGLADFELRFGRKARGLWLPECATDRATLEVAAQQGLEYTILAPWQAARRGLDPTVPYWVELAGGRRMAVFFFARNLSGKLSFDPKLTLDADAFARFHLRPAAEWLERHGDPRLLLLATDGELYGHHQPGREMFLKRLLRRSAKTAGFTVTHPGQFLDLHPPTRSIELAEPSSWSCHHGVARWETVCPCTPEARWKAPLRQAFDRLAVDLDAAYTEAARVWTDDPRALLLASIDVVLGKRPLAKLAAEHTRRALSKAELEQLADLLFAQRLRHRMFSSCGWFWSELDRIEPQNCLKAAAAAVAKTKQVTGLDPAPWLAEELAKIKSETTGKTAESFVREEWGRLA